MYRPQLDLKIQLGFFDASLQLGIKKRGRRVKNKKRSPAHQNHGMSETIV